MTAGPLRVLAIDDQQPILAAVQAELEDAGHQVILAGDGATGLALAARDLPDTILLDFRMPGMDGLQVLRALKQEATTAGIPVILLTGEQDMQLIAEGKSTKEIARLLDISAKTVETHRAHLMEKLDIRDVAGLVRFAMRVGLISQDK